LYAKSLPMPKVASVVVLSEPDRNQLESWVRSQFTPQQVVLRSRILLMAADGKQDLEIAGELNVNRHTPALWRKRFQTQGLDGVWEIQPGRGRKPSYDETKVAAIVAATLQTKPKGSTHWSCRTMARAQQVSPSTISRLWQEHNLKPHRTRSFKLSRDIKFLEKLTDVVRLYLNPPDRSVVLCIDEKSQIQALDRTQPGLPLKKGRCGTFTHDYVRHGTTTLFAALEILEGKVIGQCFPRHRHQEFLRFLRQLDDEFPEKLKLHLVLDNYGTHKHPKTRSWLERHPRFTLHFIPTSSSWLNQVERWFGELTQKAVRRGAFISVTELQKAIEQFLQAWNEAPRPFVWTATVEKIMAKVERARQRLEGIKPGWSKRKKRKNRR
jgi:transposase